MPNHVCNGATLQCPMAVPPGTSTLVVLPVNMVFTSNQPAATIMDCIPFTNILPFGMCISPTNPAFVAATAAALGTPTPVPCTPATPPTWIPGVPTVLEGFIPILDNTHKLICVLGGTITVLMPGEMTEMVP